jgi:hypothetical protein
MVSVPADLGRVGGDVYIADADRPFGHKLGKTLSSGVSDR